MFIELSISSYPNKIQKVTCQLYTFFEYYLIIQTLKVTQNILQLVRFTSVVCYLA